jgi:hypothetical protein
MESDFLSRNGERILVKVLANRTQPRGNIGSGGGRLYVTDQRLMFVPWSSSQQAGAAPFGAELADIAEADVAPRGYGL